MKKIINSLKKHLNKKNLLKILREREAVDNVGEKLGKTIDKDNPIVPHLCKALGAAAYYAGNEMAKSTARIVDEAFGDGGNYE